MTIFFLGGIDIRSEQVFSVEELYIAEAAERTVYVVDLTSSDRATLAQYRRILKARFERMGLKVLGFASATPNAEAVAERIASCGICYLPGGKVSTLLYSLRHYGLEDPIRKTSALIVGDSAGAIVLCREAVDLADKNTPKTTVSPGLGLVRFSVSPHYLPANDTQLLSLSDKRVIYGLPERSAIIHRSSGMSFEGPVCRIYEQAKQRVK